MQEPERLLLQSQLASVLTELAANQIQLENTEPYKLRVDRHHSASLSRV